MRLLRILSNKIATLRNDPTNRKFIFTFIVIVSFAVLIGILEIGEYDYEELVQEAGELYCIKDRKQFGQSINETYCFNMTNKKHQIIITCDPEIRKGKRCNVTRL